MAVEKLTKESFYLVAINGDNVNYLPLLKIMSDISPVHIFVILSDFTVEKQHSSKRRNSEQRDRGAFSFDRNIYIRR